MDLPPPPPPPPSPPASPVRVDPDDAGAADHRSPRPGELTPGWSAVLTVTWTGVAVGLAAVWNTSRQLGLATWWLGPPAQPEPLVVNVLPFVAPVAMVAASLARVRYLPWLGLLAAVLTAAVGIADLGRVTGLGIVELVLAGAGAAASLAASTGMYRAARR